MIYGATVALSRSPHKCRLIQGCLKELRRLSKLQCGSRGMLCSSLTTNYEGI